jgi:hypothetical protein
MNRVQAILDRFRRDDSRRVGKKSIVVDEGQMIANGWNGYAAEWNLEAWRSRRGRQVQYLVLCCINGFTTIDLFHDRLD